MLCVDDVDAVAGDLEWEQALFRLFNDAAELQSRLIFAVERRAAPDRLAVWTIGAREPLHASFITCASSTRPGGRKPYLRAAQRGLQLPPETPDYLLKRMPRDLPSLLEILDELDEASLVAQRRLTIPFIRDALERHARIKP